MAKKEFAEIDEKKHFFDEAEMAHGQDVIIENPEKKEEENA